MSLGMLRDLAAGQPAAAAHLLQTCRLEGAGLAAYGRAAALEQVAALGLDLAEAVSGPRFAAGFTADGQGALLADLHDGRVGRLWLLAAGAPSTPAPLRVDVPADPDLSQGGPGGVRADPMAFLEPERGAVDAVVAAVLAAPPPDVGLRRPRPILLRLVVDGPRTAALFRLEGETADAVRRPAGLNAALALGDGDPRWTLDRCGLEAELRRPWRPRL